MILIVSVDVKQQWTMLTHWSQFVPNMSTRHPRTLSITSSSWSSYPAIITGTCTPSSEVSSPSLEGGCYCARSLSWLKLLSHIAMQRVTAFICSLGVFAGVKVFWHSPRHGITTCSLCVLAGVRTVIKLGHQRRVGFDERFNCMKTWRALFQIGQLNSVDAHSFRALIY